MLLFMSGKPHVGERLARALGGDVEQVAVVTASRVAQAVNAMRARPPELLILDMTTPCEIDPEFVIARFMPMARGAPPLLIFTTAVEHRRIKHYSEIPGVHVIPFPATDTILRAVVKEYLV